MTVSYQNEVASSTSGGFTRLLFKWQGSLYKLIRQELIMFCTSYLAISIIYRWVLSEYQKRVFERVAFYCDTSMNYIPLSFILGFYVTFVATRWWQQYTCIPWPDKILHTIAVHVNGYDEKGRMIRRSMVRYLNLSLVLVLRSISSAVKKRFPTLDHLIEAGFMTSEELVMFNLVSNKEFNTYWVPCTWFTALVKEARAQKRLSDPCGIKLLMEEFGDFRQKCGMLWSYDWVSIPLVYTQVVTIATYIFFLAALIGRQFTERSPVPYKAQIDLFVPAFTLLQFFFYMGLLKVAEQLINPFGDDDEDFELNWIIDRHIKVSYLIVDTLIARAPPLTKDIFFDEESPELPYTEASAAFKKKTFRGSVANMVVPEEKQHLILPDISEEGDEESGAEGSNQSKSLRKNSNSPLKASGLYLNVNGPEISKDWHKATMNPCRTISSAASSRRSSFRSTTPPKSQHTRPNTAGSKGIGSGLVVLGSNQAVLGADWSNVEGKIPLDVLEEGSLSIQEIKEASVRSESSLDRLYVPFRDVCLDLEEPQLRSSSESINRLREWMPASIRARLAVKNKPVITWKPYQRPARRSSCDDFEDAIPTVVLEDESSFMWKTIDEESESVGISRSDLGISDQFQMDWLRPNSQQIGLANERTIKPKLSRQESGSFRLSKSSLSKSNSENKLNKRSVRTRRTSYRVKGRTRWSSLPSFYMYSSLPYIPLCKCGHGAISVKLLNSLSEASVFLEAISEKVQELRKLQASSLQPQSVDLIGTRKFKSEEQVEGTSENIGSK